MPEKLIVKKIDIADLSETRIAVEGQITEYGAEYTFFWGGRAADELREAGVGLAINSHLVRKLTSSQKEINDRMMARQLPLFGRKLATIITIYAPNMTNPLYSLLKTRFSEGK